MNQEYQEKGYFTVKALFQENELQELRKIILEFHDSWKSKNLEFYSKQAVNSAYITGTEYLDSSKRTFLFKFVGSHKLMKVVYSVIPDYPCFMNTQLFFDPVNKNQKNYWHRDPQYHLSIEEQKAALNGSEVVHLRIPLVDEPGIELIPGTHKRWDTADELDVRLEKNGHQNHENLSTGVKIELDAGDLLVFSANIIHRGLYGRNRLSLDILFCDPEPNLIEFVKNDCLPTQTIMNSLEDATAFTNTAKLKTNLI
ncbi:MAG: phytanoyl-CoA dioxygenase family protein [Cyanobacteria bacterium P01_F01_bin.143]